MKNIFKSRLKAHRELYFGMTQKEYAKKLGFHQTAIAHFERGSRKPSMDNLIKISNATYMSVDYLLGLTDND